MDILDPLDNSGENEPIETKVILNDMKGHQMESDDEQVDHLSPQTLLETQGESGVQYSLRSPEGGMITYRVLQVEDGGVDGVPQIVSTSGSNFSGNSVPQVLTSNINGQLYVIGNPSDVFSAQGGNRAIAPRPNVIDNTGVVHNIKKRDERRRATHNEVERRRRDKINNWITKLSKIIPENTHDMKGNGQYDGHSKGGILAKACEYICDLQQDQTKLEVCLKENKQLVQTMDVLKQKNFCLERENRELRDMLKRSGIDVPSEIVS